MKLSEKEYEKLKKKFDPQKIINLHCNNKITLTMKQLDELIKIRDTKERRDSNGKNKKSKTKRN